MKTLINDFPDKYISGSRRANIEMVDEDSDWFFGYGKDEFCCLEGTWGDMVYLAREILASENTKIAWPQFYHPEFLEYCEKPYEFTEKEKIIL